MLLAVLMVQPRLGHKQHECILPATLRSGKLCEQMTETMQAVLPEANSEDQHAATETYSMRPRKRTERGPECHLVETFIQRKLEV